MQGTKQGKAPIGRKAERDEGNGRGAVLLLRIICLSITRRASIIGCAYALFACADRSVVNSLVDNNNNNHRAELSEKIIDCHVNTALYTVAKPSLPLRLIKSFKIRKRKTKNEKKIRPAHVCIAPRPQPGVGTSLDVKSNHKTIVSIFHKDIESAPNLAEITNCEWRKTDKTTREKKKNSVDRQVT
jgi:hypothetical protein